MKFLIDMDKHRSGINKLHFSQDNLLVVGCFDKPASIYGNDLWIAGQSNKIYLVDVEQENFGEYHAHVEENGRSAFDMLAGTETKITTT